MAAITTYTTLKSTIADYLARSDLTSYMDNFVQQWEERFYRDSENWASWMETALSVTLAANVAAIPATYMGLRSAYMGQYQLKRVTLEQLYARYPRNRNTAGVPAFLARNGSNFEFGPENQSGTLVGTYYARPTNIRSSSTDASTHHLIVYCPDLCLYGSLLEATPFLKEDARLAVWKGAYDWALDAYRKKFREEMYSGSAPFAVVM